MPPAGPKTSLGKARSSTNAVTHGLRATALLLPGEDEVAYAAHLEGVLTSLEPVGDPELHAATMIADLQWRQSRWMRAERAAIEADAEARAQESTQRANVDAVGNALIVVDELLKVLAGSVQASDIIDLVRVIRNAMPFVETTDCRSVPAIATSLLEVERADPAEVPLAFARLREAAVVVRGELEAKNQIAKAMLAALERSLASITLSSEVDTKRLARYRRMIDSALESEVRILDVLQTRRTRRARRTADGGSFGHGVTTHEVRLRVVK